MTLKRILIIEDDAELQKIYLETFPAAEFELLFAATGSDGITQAKQNKPDLVILDIMLPGGQNGFDVLEEIKKDPELAKTKIMIVTNLDSEQKVAFSIGIDAYLVKADIKLEKIVEKARELLMFKET